VKVSLGEKQYLGMLNIGKRPTIVDKKHAIEVHIFDFSADIYDVDIKVELVKRMRDEKQFDSLETLKQHTHHQKESISIYFLLKYLL